MVGKSWSYANDRRVIEVAKASKCAPIAPLMSQKRTLTLTLAAGFSNVSERDFFGPVYFDAIRAICLNGDYRLQDNLAAPIFSP